MVEALLASIFTLAVSDCNDVEDNRMRGLNEALKRSERKALWVSHKNLRLRKSWVDLAGRRQFASSGRSGDKLANGDERIHTKRDIYYYFPMLRCRMSSDFVYV